MLLPNLAGGEIRARYDIPFVMKKAFTMGIHLPSARWIVNENNEDLVSLKGQHCETHVLLSRDEKCPVHDSEPWSVESTRYDSSDNTTLI